MKKFFAVLIVFLSLSAQTLFAEENALSFDGTNDYVNIDGSITSATTTQPITVEAWVYPTTYYATMLIASKYTGSNSSVCNFLLSWTAQKIYISGNGTNTMTSNGSAPLNEWTHVAVVFQAGTGNTKIYINGSLDISGSLNYNSSNSSTSMQIGQFTNISSYTGFQEWAGRIDEFRLWDSVRTQAELYDNMNSHLAGTENGLVAYYDFNQGTAYGDNNGLTTLTDITGHGWNGTLNNFALTGTTSNWVAGIGSADPFTQFTEIGSGLIPVYNSSATWGDFDNDFDLDVLLTGSSNDSDVISRIYRNGSGSFTDAGVFLTGVYNSSATWGDYDNDGDLDILLTGYSSDGRVSKIYRNNASVFTDIYAGLTGVRLGSAAWGDYDNDGDLDILLTGTTGTEQITKIYSNHKGTFTDINAGLPGVYYSSANWGDYDNDGDLDIVLTGSTGSAPISKIYRNDSGIFTDINAGLTAVFYSYADWGDYDSDGDLDLVITGATGAATVSKIYRNDNGVFTDINAGLQGVYYSYTDWGDFDNDGDLDLIITGTTGTVSISRIYRNDNGSFTDINAELTGVSKGCVEWGDYDNDSDLDILLTGSSSSGRVSKIYRNNEYATNTKPVAPSNLNSSIDGTKVTFSWDKSTDAQTPQNGLSYNLYIGAQSMTGNSLGPMSKIPGGYRKIVRIGNCGQNTSYTIQHLPEGTIYWSVQAVDNSFAASAFSSERSFVMNVEPPDAPLALSATNIAYTQFTALWDATEDTKGYYLDVARDAAFTDFVTGYQNRDVSNVTSYNVTGLSVFTNYYYRVRSYNGGGYSTSSNTIHAQTLLNQFTDINAGLTAVYFSSASWGDYDNDGDLDILLSGYSSAGRVSKIYRNDAGVFTDINAGLTGVSSSSIGWGDYDNDGDLDILLTGFSSSGRISIIYRNDSGVFTDIGAGLPGVSSGSTEWGDYDNDGDLDILITGDTVSEYISKIYRNDSGTFTDINAGLTGVASSSAAWGDYDNDGDLDILLTGYDTSYHRISKIYRNDNGTFIDINSGLTGVEKCSVAWGDYDNDGDLDILLTGFGATYTRISRIYRNDHGTFADINAGLTGMEDGSAAWGDYDNDGDLDILITGYNGTGYESKIYRNDGGVFTYIDELLIGIRYGSVAWGDYDNDGDLDILLTGFTWTAGYVSRIYKNISGNLNTKPNAPSNLNFTIEGSDAVLSWDKATDAQTPQNGLSYNLYIGTSPLTGNKKSPMSNTSTGYRKVVSIGNTNKTNSWSIKNLPSGNYYWSVQAVDNAFAGSLFSAESTFSLSSFTEKDTLFTPVSYSSSACGDYDNDGDLDLLITGESATGVYCTKLYNNSAGTFTEVTTGMVNISAGSVAWGDYDNDGDVDILLSGYTGSGGVTKIYRNDGSGTFTDINAGLPGCYYNSVSWADYDNDGDLDILITGYVNSTTKLSEIYRNDGNGIFTDVNAGFVNVSSGSAAWGDYDSDGDLDILLTGYSSTGAVSKVYRNDSGSFIDTNITLTGVFKSSVAWGDYDNDGDLDILLTGMPTTSTYTSKVYRNDSGVFTDIAAPILNLGYSSVAWGDYNNDGYSDIFICGYTGSSSVTKIYKNQTGSSFTDSGESFTGVKLGSFSLGDYDNDNDLDVFLSGTTGTERVSSLYTYNRSNQNTKPSAPASLSSVVNGSETTLIWNKATDAQTPQNGLSYNLYIGTTPLTGNKKSPMSNVSTGYRKVVSLGNAGSKNSYTIESLTSGTYYWSVQAVDNAYASSLFGEEKTFTVDLSVPSNVNVVYAAGNVTLSWDAVPGAVTYKVYASEDPFGTFADVSSQGTLAGTSWSQTITGNKLFYYVVAVTAKVEKGV